MTATAATYVRVAYLPEQFQLVLITGQRATHFPAVEKSQSWRKMLLRKIAHPFQEHCLTESYWPTHRELLHIIQIKLMTLRGKDNVYLRKTARWVKGSERHDSQKSKPTERALSSVVHSDASTATLVHSAMSTYELPVNAPASISVSWNTLHSGVPGSNPSTVWSPSIVRSDWSTCQEQQPHSTYSCSSWLPSYTPPTKQKYWERKQLLSYYIILYNCHPFITVNVFLWRKKRVNWKMVILIYFKSTRSSRERVRGEVARLHTLNPLHHIYPGYCQQVESEYRVKSEP